MNVDVHLSQPDFERRLIGVVSDFVQDWGDDRPITAETRLVGDLGFDSIDVIQLIVEIERHFNNRKLGFQDLLMRGGRYVDDLSIAELRDFVRDRLGAAS